MTDADALATLLVKVTVVVSLGLLFLRLAARQSAAFRHVIASTTLAAAALVPLAAAWLPPVSVVWTTQELVEPVVASTQARAGLHPASTAPQEPRMELSSFLLTGWAAGASLCLLPLLAVGYQSRQIRQQGQVWGATEATVLTLRGPRRRRIPVLFHGALSSPVVCGLFSTLIALPMSSRTWSQRDMQRALVHELAHLRRGDVLVQALARAVCAAYWFHPLVWSCWRQLRLEAERACDDAVLTRFEPSDYASQLIRIARGVTSDFASRVLPAMTKRGELTTRVEAILDASQCRSTPSVGHALPAILLGVAAAAWMACITPTTAYAVRESSSPVASFAAANVRESTATEPMTLVRLPDGGVQITAATVQVLTRLAYGVQAHAIVDAPAWMISARYDIDATPAQPAPLEATLSMLRELLAERFRLRVAHEARLQRVIVVGLPAHAVELPRATPCTSTLTRASIRLPGGLPPCGFDVAPGHIRATAVDADALAATLSTAFGARVLVEPARSGPFDMELLWTPRGGDTSPLLEALRTQVGAIVSEQERLVPILAIQSVRRPT